MIFRKAILIIHGFAGGPHDYEYLVNNLEFQKNFDVYTFTLPGHDYGIGKVKKEEWLNSACGMCEMLISFGYNSIYVIGHSMGGVIASFVASKYKEVKKLVLAAPAFHYLNIRDNDFDVMETLKAGREVLKEYKANQIIARFLKLPSNAVIQFMELVKECYLVPTDINIPLLIIEGTKDDVVPVSSVKYVFKSVKSKYKKLLMVKGVGHNLFKSKRKEEITVEIIKFLKSNTKGNKELREEI